MIILHATWLPHSLLKANSSSVFIWAEDGGQFQYHGDIIRIEGGNAENTNNIHPLSIPSDKLLGYISQLQVNIEPYLIAIKTHSRTVQLPVFEFPNRSDLPVFVEYINRRNYGDSEIVATADGVNHQLQILFNQMDRFRSIHVKETGQNLDSLPRREFELPGLEVPLDTFVNTFVSLFDTDKSQVAEVEIDEQTTIHLSMDFQYLGLMIRWIRGVIERRQIYPKLIRKQVWQQEFPPFSKQHRNSSLQLSKTTNSESYLAWWYIKESHQLSDQFTEFSQFLPTSLLSMLNYLQAYDWSKAIPYTSSQQFALWFDITSWLLNTIIRSGDGNPSLLFDVSLIDLNKHPALMFDHLHTCLVGPSPYFSQASNDVDWFATKFNNWIRKESHSSARMWDLSLILIPPEEDLLDAWYLSFILQQKSNDSLLITPDQILSGDDLPHFASSNDLLQIAMTKIKTIQQEIAPLKPYLSSKQVQLFHQLPASELPEFLNTVVPLLEQSDYGFLLPKDLERRFLPKSKVTLSVDIHTDASLNLMDYDLSLLIDGASIPIEEVLRLAQSKAGLVKINEKWINFDPQEVKKVEKLIEKQLEAPSTLDLLELEIGGIHADATYQTFASNIATKGSVISTITEKKKVSPKVKRLQATLRPYQTEGVQWLVSHIYYGIGAILADDMGLGKTIQTIATLLHLKEEAQLETVLVICPTSVIGNWMDELENFAPSLSYYLFHGSKRPTHKQEFDKIFTGTDVIISTYAIIRRDIELLRNYKWQGIILDEAQAIKNPLTKTHRGIVKLPASFRFALTGTPIENNLGELWALFNFITPSYLGNFRQFKEKFIKPIHQQEQERVDLLRAFISPFILRRHKTDPNIVRELPDKIEKKVISFLTKEQVSLYHAVTTASLEKLVQSEGIQRRGIILATMTRLKQICNHPSNYLRDGSIAVNRSGKFQVLVDLLETIFENNEKVVIFSQYRVMCSLIIELIESQYHLPLFEIHGGTAVEKRVRSIEHFSKSIGSAVFVISLKAGGTGLNLHAANHVIHFDRWWNPAVENQASDRAYRIGQTKDVMIYKFISKGTLEEKIDRMIDQKLELSNKVIDGIRSDFTSMSIEEFKELIELRSILEE